MHNLKSSNVLTSLHLRLMHISEDGYIQECDLAPILNVLAESSIAGLKRGFDALNNYLASHTFLVGDGVTLVEEEEAPKSKPKNPLDLLPPSNMVLDDRKRLYSNTMSNFCEVAHKGIYLQKKGC
uniref:Putative translation elongation factor EF1B, gamma chain, conserved n=1 Tax=Helianthus annuus TaxID=4232 RepID=A0A251VGC6_HELAN